MLFRGGVALSGEKVVFYKCKKCPKSTVNLKRLCNACLDKEEAKAAAISGEHLSAQMIERIFGRRQEQPPRAVAMGMISTGIYRRGKSCGD